MRKFWIMAATVALLGFGAAVVSAPAGGSTATTPPPPRRPRTTPTTTTTEDKPKKQQRKASAQKDDDDDERPGPRSPTPDPRRQTHRRTPDNADHAQGRRRAWRRRRPERRR